MRDLIAVSMPGGPAFVDVLRRVWDDGDALLPLDPRLPRPALERLLDALRPAAIIDGSANRSVRLGGEPVADGDALVVATSGSTGEPKGVVHTHDSVRASAEATNAGLGTDPATDRWLCCLPLSHVAGLSVITRALTAGTPLEVLPAFDADAVEAAARERGATLTSLVPTALRRIDPRLFRRLVVGGSAPPRLLPPNAVVSYGLTETGSAVAFDGQALPNVELDIVEDQILVRGPMLLRAYRDGTDPRNERGWLPTGDAGEWASDGRLIVHGRAGDMIVSGGENVWPVEVERVLSSHPAIAEVAVVGRDDPEWGQKVVAVIVPSDPAGDLSLTELRAFAKEQLPAYAVPRELETVEALPRTVLGKVRRTALAPVDRTVGPQEG